MAETVEQLKALHAKQAAWIARNPKHDETRIREHALLTARIAAMESNRATYVIPTKRAPQRTWTRPERPEGGYHIRDESPVVSNLRDMDHMTAIETGAAALQRLSADLHEIDERISELDESMSDDGWDDQDMDALLDERSVTWWQLAQVAGDMHAHIGYLLDEGMSPDVSGRALAVVIEHVPGLLTGRAWQAIGMVA